MGDPPPVIVVLTGPSGVGKDSVVDRLVEIGVPVVRPATMTTRAPRAGEQEGVHHYFVDGDGFRAAVDSGELLEHAEVYGQWYGVPRKAIRAALESGTHVVIRVDIQGAETLHQLLPGALFICLEPGDADDLDQRLAERGTEAAEDRARRVAAARAEIERARRFCRVVVNRDGALAEAVDAVARLIDAEWRRPGRTPVAL